MFRLDCWGVLRESATFYFTVGRQTLHVSHSNTTLAAVCHLLQPSSKMSYFVQLTIYLFILFVLLLLCWFLSITSASEASNCLQLHHLPSDTLHQHTDQRLMAETQTGCNFTKRVVLPPQSKQNTKYILSDSLFSPPSTSSISVWEIGSMWDCYWTSLIFMLITLRHLWFVCFFSTLVSSKWQWYGASRVFSLCSEPLWYLYRWMLTLCMWVCLCFTG